MDNGYHHHRRSLFGPIVLIAIGVLFLLRNRLPGFDAYRFLAHYWPALLIVWGLVRLVEHYTEAGSGGLSGGEVALLVVVIIFGLALTASLSFRHWHWNGDWQGGPPWQQEYHFHGASQAELPRGMPVMVRGSRASVELIATPGNTIRASVDDAVRAGSHARARSRFDSATLEMHAENGAWVVRPAGRDSSRRVSARLRLYLPATTPVTVHVRHGDLQAAGWRAALRLVSDDGAITVSHPGADVHIQDGNGTVIVSAAAGTVDIQGGDEISVRGAQGAVTLREPSPQDVSLADLPAGFSLTNGKTRITCRALAGSFDLTGDSLNASGARDLQVRTGGRDIAVRGFQGTLRIRDQNGAVAALPAPGAKLGAVSIRDSSGDIALAWPPAVGFQLDAAARGGEIFGDWGVPVQRHHGRSAAAGSFGGGGVLVYLRTTDGSISRTRLGNAPGISAAAPGGA